MTILALKSVVHFVESADFLVDSTYLKLLHKLAVIGILKKWY
jgi:hypothetical protein